MADSLFDAIADAYRDELRRRGWKRIPAGVTAYGGYAVDHYECPETHVPVPEGAAFAAARAWLEGPPAVADAQPRQPGEG